METAVQCLLAAHLCIYRLLHTFYWNVKSCDNAYIFFSIFFLIYVFIEHLYMMRTLFCRVKLKTKYWLGSGIEDFLMGMCRSLDAWNVFECDPSKLVLIEATDKLGENMFYCPRNWWLDSGDLVLLNSWVYAGLSCKKGKASSSFSLFWWNHPFFAPTSHLNKVAISWFPQIDSFVLVM